MSEPEIFQTAKNILAWPSNYTQLEFRLATAVTILKEAISRHGLQAEPRIDCNNCHKCLEEKTDDQSGLPVTSTRMVLCPTCGNKRCPKASNHILACTHSNDSGQSGSIY